MNNNVSKNMNNEKRNDKSVMKMASAKEIIMILISNENNMVIIVTM
jgi:hypothetical protein